MCLLWCGYTGSSLEVKIEADSADALQIKTEHDSNDVTRYLRRSYSYAGMFAVSDAVLSSFICLFVTCTECTLLISCCCCVYYKSRKFIAFNNRNVFLEFCQIHHFWERKYIKCVKTVPLFLSLLLYFMHLNVISKYHHVLPCKPVPNMTYNVFGGTLNIAQLNLTPAFVLLMLSEEYPARPGIWTQTNAHTTSITTKPRPFFSDRQHLSYDVCLEVRGEIIWTVLCCIVYWLHSQTHT